MTSLDCLHARIVRIAWLQAFTAFTRVLLAVGFLPPGLKKLRGEPFTTLPVTHPVGYFFDAFFQAGGFYAFVGAVQVLAALMLLWPRTATLGAVLYAPVIFTITVVTWSLGFYGTNWVTLAMSVACLYLLCWDYDRLRALLPQRRALAAPLRWWEIAGWAAFGAAGGATTWALAAAIRLAMISWSNVGVLAGLVAGGAAFGVAMAAQLSRWPVPADPRQFPA